MFNIFLQLNSGNGKILKLNNSGNHQDHPEMVMTKKKSARQGGRRRSNELNNRNCGYENSMVITLTRARLILISTYYLYRRK